MRQPRRWRNLALAVFTASAAALTTALVMPEHRDPPNLQTALRAGGIVVGILSLFALAFAQAQTVGQARLLRGVRVLARWRVDAARCETFIDQAASPGPVRPGTPVNDQLVRRPVPPDGVDVIIGERSLQVGEHFRFLHREVWGVDARPGPPPWLEFRTAHFRTNGPPLEIGLRVPIGAGAEADAARVLAHHRVAVASRRPRLGGSIVQRYPVRVRNIAFGVAVAGAVSFAGGWLLRHRQDLDALPVLVMVAGTMVALVALVLGVVAARTARAR